MPAIPKGTPRPGTTSSAMSSLARPKKPPRLLQYQQPTYNRPASATLISNTHKMMNNYNNNSVFLKSKISYLGANLQQWWKHVMGKAWTDILRTTLKSIAWQLKTGRHCQDDSLSGGVCEVQSNELPTLQRYSDSSLFRQINTAPNIVQHQIRQFFTLRLFMAMAKVFPLDEIESILENSST